ncbi:hypothetical protein QYM36_008492 [Artemia franciscana]|uniref:Uncharacterized protein n=1 Tax=Artemia franciscana TaxID=6661 RepID=A0AA88IVA8_ARTSF|nr:hypothetical protein QYM36_008492 [Artemia franciscana]
MPLLLVSSITVQCQACCKRWYDNGINRCVGKITSECTLKWLFIDCNTNSNKQKHLKLESRRTIQHRLPFSVAIRITRLNKRGTAIKQPTAFGRVMTPTSYLKRSTKNTTPSPTPFSILLTMPLVDNEDMSTAKYLKQVLIASPSSLEESEIEVLQEMISVLKKDLSSAR